mgnify:CR=1 FL=1
MLNVVILNGGRGASTIIPALLSKQRLYVTSVVNAYDDGKSTGAIRRFFGMLGPSDIRKVQELMLPKDDPDYENYVTLFQYRFSLDCNRKDVLEQLKLFSDSESMELVGIRLNNIRVREKLQSFLAEFLTGLNTIEKARQEQFDFADCSIMNCLYAGAFLASNRNIEQATVNIDRLFQLCGTVLPTSIEDKQLVAQRENGEILYSEAEIVELRSNVRVERIYLLDQSLDKSTFEISAFRRSIFERSTFENDSCEMSIPSSFAKENNALFKFALLKLAPVKSVDRKSTPSKLAPLKFAFRKLALKNMAPRRSKSTKFFSDKFAFAPKTLELFALSEIVNE